jgi:Iap family predicted aminopeptidase
MRFIRTALCRALLGVLACATLVVAQGSKTASTGDSFRTQVTAISAGKDNVARRAAITKRLDRLGIKYRLEEFKRGAVSGTNIIAELKPSGPKVLMLGAHYDRVEQGSGAVDNASGSSTVLELLAALSASPLKKHSVAAVFFDMEEEGLLGSANYSRALAKQDLPALFVNFDVFGYGDTLWVWAKDPDTGVARAIADAAAAKKFPIQLGPGYPPSDHLSFVRLGVESLSFSLIDGSEIPGILSIFKGERPEKAPRVMSIIHSPDDTVDKIDFKAVSRGIQMVEQVVRAIDERP